MYPATTCDYSRKFNSLRESRIHQACWRKQRNSSTGECKSNDGPMNQDYPHSIHERIAKRQRPGDIPSKPRIHWPKGNQITTWTNLDQELSFYSPPILRASLMMDIERISTWMIYTRNHLSRVITQNQETVAISTAKSKRVFKSHHTQPCTVFCPIRLGFLSHLG